MSKCWNVVIAKDNACSEVNNTFSNLENALEIAMTYGRLGYSVRIIYKEPYLVNCRMCADDTPW